LAGRKIYIADNGNRRIQILADQRFEVVAGE